MEQEDHRPGVRAAGQCQAGLQPLVQLTTAVAVMRLQCILMPRMVSGASVSMAGLGHRTHQAQQTLAVMAAEAVGPLTHRTRTAATAAVLATVHRDADKWTPEEAEAFKAPIRQKYEDEGNPYHATARLWDDGIIDPAQTRDVLALAFSATLNAPVEDRGFGVFRM